MSVPLFDEAVLKSISDILGDTHSGFSGWEIAEMLARCEIEDPVVNDNYSGRFAPTTLAARSPV